MNETKKPKEAHDSWGATESDHIGVHARTVFLLFCSRSPPRPFPFLSYSLHGNSKTHRFTKDSSNEWGSVRMRECAEKWVGKIVKWEKVKSTVGNAKNHAVLQLRWKCKVARREPSIVVWQRVKWHQTDQRQAVREYDETITFREGKSETAICLSPSRLSRLSGQTDVYGRDGVGDSAWSGGACLAGISSVGKLGQPFWRL